MQRQEIKIAIRSDGSVAYIYNDALDAQALTAALGVGGVRRASHVEPTSDSKWTADMGPMNGPVLGPFEKRAQALKAETDWLARELFGGAS